MMDWRKTRFAHWFGLHSPSALVIGECWCQKKQMYAHFEDVLMEYTVADLDAMHKAAGNYAEWMQSERRRELMEQEEYDVALMRRHLNKKMVKAINKLYPNAGKCYYRLRHLPEMGSYWVCEIHGFQSRYEMAEGSRAPCFAVDQGYPLQGPQE